MTLDELLSKTADEWDRLTLAEREEWARQYFTVTRPEEAKATRAKEEQKKPEKKARMNTYVDHIAEARRLAERMGIKIP